MTRGTITTDATVSREAHPELATVEVTAIGEGASATAARTNADDCAATVREALTETAVSEAAIRTVEFRVEESSQLFDGDDDVPYRATKRLRVDCVPETVSEVVVVTADAGGTVPAVRFGLRDDVRRSLREEALEAAMERARGRAELIAAAEGVEILGVQDVTTVDAGTGMDGLVDEALARNGDSNFFPEPITVTEEVEVVYRIAGD